MHVQHFFLFSLLIQEFYLRGQNRKEKVVKLVLIYTVLLSNLSHQRDSTVPHRTAPQRTAPHRTATLLFKNAVTFKRDVFDPLQHATLH